jgi:hypothetical protein
MSSIAPVLRCAKRNVARNKISKIELRIIRTMRPLLPSKASFVAALFLKRAYLSKKN